MDQNFIVRWRDISDGSLAESINHQQSMKLLQQQQAEDVEREQVEAEALEKRNTAAREQQQADEDAELEANRRKDEADKAEQARLLAENQVVPEKLQTKATLTAEQQAAENDKQLWPYIIWPPTAAALAKLAVSQTPSIDVKGTDSPVGLIQVQLVAWLSSSLTGVGVEAPKLDADAVKASEIARQEGAEMGMEDLELRGKGGDDDEDDNTAPNNVVDKALNASQLTLGMFRDMCAFWGIDPTELDARVKVWFKSWNKKRALLAYQALASAFLIKRFA